MNKEWRDIMISDKKLRSILPNTNETTYVMVKPYSADDIENKRAQEITVDYLQKRFEQNGLKIAFGEEIKYGYEQIGQHYAEHIDRYYYNDLEKMMATNTVYGMFVQARDENIDPLNKVREIAGSTIKIDNEGNVTRFHEPGSIRYDLSFILYQTMKLHKNMDDVVVPKNIDGCTLKYDDERNYVKVFDGEGNLINDVPITANFIHSSGSYKEAQNEIKTFNDASILYKYNNYKAKQKADKRAYKEAKKAEKRAPHKEAEKVEKRQSKNKTSKTVCTNKENSSKEGM